MTPYKAMACCPTWRLFGQPPAHELSYIKARSKRFGTVACMLKTDSDPVPVLTEALLRRLDRPGSRYTSYPTADRFVEAFGPADHAQALQQRERFSRVI